MTELLARTDPPADTEDTKTPTTGGDAAFRGMTTLLGRAALRQISGGGPDD